MKKIDVKLTIVIAVNLYFVFFLRVQPKIYNVFSVSILRVDVYFVYFVHTFHEVSLCCTFEGYT